MSEAQTPKPTRKLALTPDQFDVDETGNVVIRSEEIKAMIAAQPATGQPPEAGAVSVSVTVEVST